MELREKIARATSQAILEQDCMEGDCLDTDLRIDYLDQGITDFGKVADAILSIPEIREALELAREAEEPTPYIRPEDRQQYQAAINQERREMLDNIQVPEQPEG
jgi:hypothetical protein